MRRNNTLDEALVNDTNDALADIAQCLIEYLQIHGWNGQPCDVLRYLANETESRIRDGKGVLFSTSALYAAIRGGTGGDQSQWMSRIWNDLTSRLLPQRQDGLIAFSRDRGLNHYPWVAKVPSPGGAGNPALYHLEARRLPPNEQSKEQARPESSGINPCVHYIPELKPKPAWLLSWLFSKRYSGTGWRKWIGLLVPLIWILSLLGLLLFAGLILGQDKAPLTAQHLTYLIFILGRVHN